jgi:hypothetical protein
MRSERRVSTNKLVTDRRLRARVTQNPSIRPRVQQWWTSNAALDLPGPQNVIPIGCPEMSDEELTLYETPCENRRLVDHGRLGICDGWL